MKTILLGGVLTLAGALLSGLILVSAAITSSGIGSWSGNKLMYAIFQEQPLSFGSVVIGGMFLISVLMWFVGVVILFQEWYLEWAEAADAQKVTSPLSEDVK
ncbi:hypothetical protein ACFO0S_14545 [Chryseomicrobium palamuruense]|uniref:Uncharacterized protein n=1 Tax=Chryseomicrobium palamuruense TaxID=682973 RepID=A0ABV8UZP9_9BACL